MPNITDVQAALEVATEMAGSAEVLRVALLAVLAAFPDGNTPSQVRARTFAVEALVRAETAVKRAAAMLAVTGEPNQ